MTVFIAGRTPARLFHVMTGKKQSGKNIMETTFISKENGQLLAGVDDLIPLIGRKVIVGKNITT